MLRAWMLLQHVPADTGAWAGTKAQLGRNTGCYSLEWQAGKATGAHRGGLVQLVARGWHSNMLLVALELQHVLKLNHSAESRPTRRI